jgi:hypothetical protein
MAKSSSKHIAVPTKVSQPGDALDDLIPPSDDSFLDGLAPDEAILDVPPLDDSFLDGLALDEAVLDALLPPLDTVPWTSCSAMTPSWMKCCDPSMTGNLSMPFCRR